MRLLGQVIRHGNTFDVIRHGNTFDDCRRPLLRATSSPCVCERRGSTRVSLWFGLGVDCCAAALTGRTGRAVVLVDAVHLNLDLHAQVRRARRECLRD